MIGAIEKQKFVGGPMSSEGICKVKSRPKVTWKNTSKNLSDILFLGTEMLNF